MKLKVNCPVCGIRISMRVRDTASPVKCLTCGCSFIAIEDSEVPCPRCNSIVIVPLGQARNRVSCLSCGFTFGESRIKHYSLWLLLAAVWGQLAFYCFLACLAGLLKAQRCHVRNPSENSGCSVTPVLDSRRSVNPVEHIKHPFWRLWISDETEG